MQDICRAFGFPAKVLAAALLYLKRAYLAFSALDHDPKDVMLTCIYLAGKVGASNPLCEGLNPIQLLALKTSNVTWLECGTIVLPQNPTKIGKQNAIFGMSTPSCSFHEAIIRLHPQLSEA